MRKLLINNTLEFLEDDDAVIDLVEEHMGYDTANVIRDMIDDNACGSEHVDTYPIHNHYMRVIREIADELENLAVYAKHKARLDRIICALKAEL